MNAGKRLRPANDLSTTTTTTTRDRSKKRKILESTTPLAYPIKNANEDKRPFVLKGPAKTASIEPLDCGNDPRLNRKPSYSKEEGDLGYKWVDAKYITRLLNEFETSPKDVIPPNEEFDVRVKAEPACAIEEKDVGISVIDLIPDEFKSWLNEESHNDVSTGNPDDLVEEKPKLKPKVEIRIPFCNWMQNKYPHSHSIIARQKDKELSYRDYAGVNVNDFCARSFVSSSGLGFSTAFERNSTKDGKSNCFAKVVHSFLKPHHLFNELTKHDSRCNFFLDIDVKYSEFVYEWDDPSKEALLSFLIDKFLKDLKRCLLEILNLLNVEWKQIKISVLDASNHSKISRHVIMSVDEGKIGFSDKSAVHFFLCSSVERFCRRCKKYAVFKNNEKSLKSFFTISVLDVGVYEGDKELRLFGSTKKGEDRHLVLKTMELIERTDPNASSVELTGFLYSLLTTPKTTLVIKFPKTLVKEKNRTQTSFSNDVLPFGDIIAATNVKKTRHTLSFDPPSTSSSLSMEDLFHQIKILTEKWHAAMKSKTPEEIRLGTIRSIALDFKTLLLDLPSTSVSKKIDFGVSGAKCFYLDGERYKKASRTLFGNFKTDTNGTSTLDSNPYAEDDDDVSEEDMVDESTREKVPNEEDGRFWKEDVLSILRKVSGIVMESGLGVESSAFVPVCLEDVRFEEKTHNFQRALECCGILNWMSVFNDTFVSPCVYDSDGYVLTDESCALLSLNTLNPISSSSSSSSCSIENEEEANVLDELAKEWKRYGKDVRRKKTFSELGQMSSLENKLCNLFEAYRLSTEENAVAGDSSDSNVRMNPNPFNCNNWFRNGGGNFTKKGGSECTFDLTPEMEEWLLKEIEKMKETEETLNVSKIIKQRQIGTLSANLSNAIVEDLKIYADSVFSGCKGVRKYNEFHSFEDPISDSKVESLLKTYAAARDFVFDDEEEQEIENEAEPINVKPDSLIKFNQLKEFKCYMLFHMLQWRYCPTKGLMGGNLGFAGYHKRNYSYVSVNVNTGRCVVKCYDKTCQAWREKNLWKPRDDPGKASKSDEDDFRSKERRTILDSLCFNLSSETKVLAKVYVQTHTLILRMMEKYPATKKVD
jgi:hypothetical protein